MYQSKDWVGFALNQPMAAAPGSQFNYSGANMNLLAAMIGKAWRLPAREVARTRFLTHWNHPVLWDGVDPEGNTIGESSLYLLPTDMVRLGLFWLHDGVWQDRRILPAGWTGNVLADALPAEPGDGLLQARILGEPGEDALPASGGMAKPSWSTRPWTWSSSSPGKVATTKNPTLSRWPT